MAPEMKAHARGGDYAAFRESKRRRRGSTGGRRAARREKGMSKRSALAGQGGRGLFLKERGSMGRHGCHLPAAMVRATNGVIVAGRGVAEGALPVAERGAGGKLAIAAAGQNWLSAMRGDERRTPAAGRSRPGERRKQQPKERGELAQDGAPVRVAIVA